MLASCMLYYITSSVLYPVLLQVLHIVTYYTALFVLSDLTALHYNSLHNTTLNYSAVHYATLPYLLYHVLFHSMSRWIVWSHYVYIYVCSTSCSAMLCAHVQIHMYILFLYLGHIISPHPVWLNTALLCKVVTPYAVMLCYARPCHVMFC